MLDDRWYNVDEKPKLYFRYDTYFSEQLLIKVKDNTMKGYYYVVGYLNDTDHVWINSFVEQEISEEVLNWKYIE